LRQISARDLVLALRAGLDRCRHGKERDHGLAAADVTLQQAEHAVRAGEVGVDLGERARLRSRQREGELGEDFPAELASRGKPPSGALLEPLANDGKGELIGEKLVIGNAPSCRRRREKVGLGLGRMQTGKRLGETRPGVLRAKSLIDPLRQRRQPRQRLGDRSAQHRIVEARGQRIDGLERWQRARAVDGRHVVRVRHLQPAVIGFELA
jgi:hypothetical protein